MKRAAILSQNFYESLEGLLPVDRLFDEVPDIVFSSRMRRAAIWP